MIRQPAFEDLEAFADQLQGPLGAALRTTGAIIALRMRERNLQWDDLDDVEVLNFFVSAFQEAALEAYPNIDSALIDEAVSSMSASLMIELAATVDGVKSVN